MSITRVFICEYRNCKKKNITDNNKMKYCGKKCCDAEYRRRAYDKQCKKNPTTRKNEIRYDVLLGNRPKEYNNPNFSVKWIEEAWNKVRHEYINA